MKNSYLKYVSTAKVALTALLSVSTVQGQESGSTQEPIVDLEDYVVRSTPIFHSQQESIELQRFSTKIVSVVASDAIGRFPDQNAAAALSRLPAVAVQRDQGQERYIQVRGAPARWTTVSFDGVTVLGADERIFRFDSVPAAIIDTVEVFKTLTADMPAESIAGRVNIKTNSGLDVGALQLSSELSYGFLDLGNGMQRRASLGALMGGEKWGISASASHYLMDQITDNREFEWDIANEVYNTIELRSYQIRRQNNSGSFKFDYRPDDQNHIYISSIYAEFVDHEERNQYVLTPEDAIMGQQTAEGGQLVGVPMRGMLENGRYFNSTFTNTLGGKHEWGEGWEVDWKVNFTRTDSNSALPIVMQLQTDPSNFHSIIYSAANRDEPVIELYGTDFRPEMGVIAMSERQHRLNQTSFDLDLLLPIYMTTITNAMSYSVDFDKEWDLAGSPATLEFGFQYDDRRAKGNTLSSYNTLYLSPLAGAVGLPWNSNNYVTEARWDSRFELGFEPFYVNNHEMGRDLNETLGQLEAYGLYDPNENVTPSDKFDIDESILAAYVMNTWQKGNHQIIAGLRIEQASVSSGGFATITGQDEAGDDVSETVAQNFEKDFTNLFPSIHYNYDVSETVKLRVAGVSGIGRPDFGQMRVGSNISDTDRSIFGGNPDLDPEKTYGIDASIEWYFDKGALLSAGVFYRSVEDVLFDSTTSVEDDRFDSAGIDRTGYNYITTLNGGSGTLSGLELSYLHRWQGLPSFLEGLGIQINAALLDGEFETPEGRDAPFPGTSDTVINTSLFYENYGFSIRLSHQWRDDWIDDISFATTDDVYWATTERVDFSIRYQISEDVSIFMDANNLSDERGVRFQGERKFPVEVEGFGRRFLFGIRGKF